MSPFPELRSLKARHRGFTLVELLAVLAILSVLTAISVSTLASLEANARVERTKTLIARLDQLIMEKYEAYKSRPVPFRVPAGMTPQDAALVRLYALRELMRMELPDRLTDLQDGPGNIVVGGKNYGKLPAPAAWKSMRKRLPSSVTSQYDGAECLYLIISTIRTGDTRAIDSLTSREVGDVDQDGLPEILDAWGQPISFLRWAPGFTIENGALTSQTSNAVKAPDPYDVLKVDPRLVDSDKTNDTYSLKPLIFSGGRDRKFDIGVGFGVNYATGGKFPPSDPFYNDAATAIGKPEDFDSDGFNHIDNITNHYLEVR